MKISKLFHWLYAILMLLPFLVFLPNAFYYGFNEQAVAQEKTEQVPIYYESNEVNNIGDLHVGNIYHWDDNFTPSHTYTNTQLLFYITWSNIPNINNNYDICGVFINNVGNVFVNPSYNDNVSYFSIIDTPFDFVLGATRVNFNSTSDIIDYISKSNYLLETGEYQPITTSMSITDSMSYAWDSVWQNDLFSWSYGSFLTEPFIYIGNVFNVPVDNSLYYALSYWLDISIIWLCFDVIMYVPLLVHRWLDKGIVE